MEKVLLWLRAIRARIIEAPRVVQIAGGAILLLLIIFCTAWWLFIAAPSAFPTDSIIEVPSEMPASTLGEHLQEVGVIKSPLAFHVWMRLTGADREIHAGSYYFARPLTLFSVVSRIRNGERGVESIRVTLTEGMTAKEMGQRLAESLPDFDADAFTKLAKEYEGHLFPDTYFIDPGTTPEEVVERLRDTFLLKTDALRVAAESRGQSFERIVIMASIIEKEADTPEDRRIVSGILWNRIEEDMPLQVDAVFGYIYGLSGYAPAGEDLEIDSPYNTYTNRDLPPGPIANPGLDAIEAALTPSTTEYFYYLTGRDGLMYYAHNFEEHKRNRELYLD